MHMKRCRPRIGAGLHKRLSTTIAVVLSVSLVGLLAALPTASASASVKDAASTPTITPVTPAELEGLLSGLPIGDLNTSELAEVIAKLPGLEGLPTEAIAKTLESLGSDPLGTLLNPSEVVPTMLNDLEKTLGLTKLLTLLGSNSTETLTKALETTDLTELLGSLLGTSANPGELLTQLFGLLNPSSVEGVLGSLPGQPFSESTVEGVANELGMSVSELSEKLNVNSLEPSVKALTAPLTNGKTLLALEGLEGLALGLLGGKETAGGEGGASGGGGGSGGSGSSGGSGGSGGAGGAGSTTTIPSGDTTIIEMPGSQTTVTAIPTTAAKAAAKTGKIKILKHSVKGKAVTLVVQVPGAGKISLGGKGVKSLSREAAKAERVTLRTTLTKASAGALRKHRHRKLKVKLTTGFKLVGGSASSASVTVTFA